MDEAILGRVSAGDSLETEEMAQVMDEIMSGQWGDERIALLLTGLRAKGETSEEIAGAATAMRKHMTKIPTQRKGVIDTCGTGGDGSGTFNISTAAALVTAASGVPVAKHGNRAITSKTGSAEVLHELGVNVEADVPVVANCLDELGICFCMAPLLHPAMKNVATVRRSLSFPTIFNLLGPLSNPAEAQYQLIGVGKPHLRTVLAAALQQLPVERAVVVCGDDGIDEVSLSEASQVSLVRGDVIESLVWTPDDFGLKPAGKSTMLVENPQESAALILRILAGDPGPPRDIVVLNAASAIWTAEPETSKRECVERVQQAIDSGEASRLLAGWSEASHS